MSKNTIDSITEQEEKVESSTSLSSDDVGDSIDLQGVTLQSESLGINEMSTQPASNEEEELDELSLTSQPTGGEDVSTSTDGKSQLRNFLSVAKAKWDNVPQGWMQQRTNKGDWRSLVTEAPLLSWASLRYYAWGALFVSVNVYKQA